MKAGPGRGHHLRRTVRQRRYPAALSAAPRLLITTMLELLPRPRRALAY